MSTDHFDERAATWDDDPSHVERAAVVADAIADRLTLTTSTSLLEYGAGTGLATAALRDRVGDVTVADTSTGMRDVMARKVDAGVLRDARIWDVDLATTPPPPGEQFDVVLTVLTLHHIPEVDVVLQRFHELVAPDGHLAIVDLDHEDGSFHTEGFTGHHGFRRADLAERLERTGFTDVSFSDCHHVTREHATFPMFLAIASRT